MHSIDQAIGSTGLPIDVLNEISDLVARLEETYNFKHGSTAAYWAVAHTLAGHVSKGKE